jgi:hypothetical protein
VEVDAFRERLIAAVRTADYAAVDVVADEMGVADVDELVDLHDVVASEWETRRSPREVLPVPRAADGPVGWIAFPAYGSAANDHG